MSAEVARKVRKQARGVKGGISLFLASLLERRECARLGSVRGRSPLTFFVSREHYKELQQLGNGSAADGARFVLTGEAMLPCTVDQMTGRQLAALARPWAEFRGRGV